MIDAWSKKGKKIDGNKQGKRGKRENLVAGKRKGEKDFIAPMIFTGSLNAEGLEGWLSTYFLTSLKKTSIVIMDNAPIHRKKYDQIISRRSRTQSFIFAQILTRFK